MKSHKNAGRSVAELRKIIGKSQSQFAAMIGVSKHTVISVENRRNRLSRNLSNKIKVATGSDLLHVKPAKPVYTLDAFNRWRGKYYPSDEATARMKFDKLQLWVKVVLLAAAKSGPGGNRDRLPAVCLSLIEWLEATRTIFKLQREIDDVLSDETHHLNRVAIGISSLLDDPVKARERLTEHAIDFNRIKKQLQKNVLGGFLIIEDEVRCDWGPDTPSFVVVCKTRKLIPKAKCWIRKLPPPPQLLPESIDVDLLTKLCDERSNQVWKFLEETAPQDLLSASSYTAR
jgi:DNA-binding XRE family transcriptional regulator